MQIKDLPPLVPGTLDRDWVGNTHSDFLPGDGDGNGNGYGRWVQNGMDEVEVTPDGTVVVGTVWDEGGRNIGIYKNGTVNLSCLGKPRKTTCTPRSSFIHGNHDPRSHQIRRRATGHTPSPKPPD